MPSALPGPSGSPRTDSLPRPKSTSTLHRPAPYMVALAGWPEPVYIAHDPSRWGRKRSRSNTPRPSVSVAVVEQGGEEEKGEGSKIVEAPKESILSRSCMYVAPGQICPVPGHPNHLKHEEGSGTIMSESTSTGCETWAEHPFRLSQIPHSTVSSPTQNQLPRNGGMADARSAPLISQSNANNNSAYPTSSTRSSASSPVLASSPLPTQLNPSTSIISGNSKRSRSTFSDPRLAPHLDRITPLSVVPTWSTSTSSSSGSTSHRNISIQPTLGQGRTVQAGPRGTGLLIMRSTPEMYPKYSRSEAQAQAQARGLAGMALDMTRISTNGNGNGKHESGTNTPNPTSAGGTGTGPGAGTTLGMATEVYPRDPDQEVLWGAGSRVGSRRQSRAGSLAGEEGKDGMEVDMV